MGSMDQPMAIFISPQVMSVAGTSTEAVPTAHAHMLTTKGGIRP